jgi:hypothetical protein
MGSGSTLANVLLFLAALARVLRSLGHRVGSPNAVRAAAENGDTQHYRK